MSKKIFLSPSNQFENIYAAGNTNEGTQCGEVAKLLKKKLEDKGFEVKLVHDEYMSAKCSQANKWGADLYVPIHSNAGGGHGTRMFCFDRSSEGFQACQDILKYLGPVSPGKPDTIVVDPTLYEVKWPHAPTAYIEMDFHDDAETARYIVDHKDDFAQAICDGICQYFGVQVKKAETYAVQLPNLQQGDESGYVLTAQILLNQYNGAHLEEDGDFGPATHQAVLAYQKDRKLDADGIIGPQTWAQLLK